jgi:hypothetical protein
MAFKAATITSSQSRRDRSPDFSLSILARFPVTGLLRVEG